MIMMTEEEVERKTVEEVGGATTQAITIEEAATTTGEGVQVVGGGPEEGVAEEGIKIIEIMIMVTRRDSKLCMCQVTVYTIRGLFYSARHIIPEVIVHKGAEGIQEAIKEDRCFHVSEGAENKIIRRAEFLVGLV